MLNFSSFSSLNQIQEIPTFLQNNFCVNVMEIVDRLLPLAENKSEVKLTILFREILKELQTTYSEYNFETFLFSQSSPHKPVESCSVNIRKNLPDILLHHCMIHSLYTFDYIAHSNKSSPIPLSSHEKLFYDLKENFPNIGILKDNTFISKAVGITKPLTRYCVSDFQPLISKYLLNCNKKHKFRSYLSQANKAENTFNKNDYIKRSIYLYCQQYNELFTDNIEIDVKAKKHTNASVKKDTLYKFHMYRLYGFDIIEILLDKFAYQYQSVKCHKDKISFYDKSPSELDKQKEFCHFFDDKKLEEFVLDCISLPNSFTRKYLLNELLSCSTDYRIEDILTHSTDILRYFNRVLFPLYEQSFIFVIYKLLIEKGHDYLMILKNAIRSFTFKKSNVLTTLSTDTPFFKNQSEYGFFKHSIFKYNADSINSYETSSKNANVIMLTITRYQDKLLNPSIPYYDFDALRLFAKKLSIMETPFSRATDKAIYAQFYSKIFGHSNSNDLYTKLLTYIAELHHQFYNKYPIDLNQYKNTIMISILTPGDSLCRLELIDETYFAEKYLHSSCSDNEDLSTNIILQHAEASLSKYNIPLHSLLSFPYFRVLDSSKKQIDILYCLDSSDNYDMASYCNESSSLAPSKYCAYRLKYPIMIAEIPSFVIYQYINKANYKTKDILPLICSLELISQLMSLLPATQGFRYKSTIGNIYVLFNLPSDDIIEKVETFIY